MKFRSVFLAFIASTFPVAAFSQGAGSWASGSDLLALFFGLVGLPFVGILGLVSARWLLTSGRPYLFLIPVAAGITYLKIWPANICTQYNPCTDGQQILGFLIGFVPVSIVVWLIARIVWPSRRNEDSDAAR